MMISTYSILISEHIINIAKHQYQLNPNGIHAFNHWERVYQNGMYLCDHEQADKHVVGLFAFFHDCCRQNDSIDANHGVRAAEFLKSLSKEFLQVDEAQFNLLYYACKFHNKGYVSDDATIGGCWDADRLDLYRVGIYPDQEYLSTNTAKNPDLIKFCSGI